MTIQGIVKCWQHSILKGSGCTSGGWHLSEGIGGSGALVGVGRGLSPLNFLNHCWLPFLVCTFDLYLTFLTLLNFAQLESQDAEASSLFIPLLW